METLWSEKGYFGLLGNAHILFYYPILSYQRVEVYRVETMDMGGFNWNKGVSVICNPSKYHSNYCNGLDILVEFVRC